MKRRGVELLRRLLRWAYAVLPKLPFAVVWGHPDHEDNVLALEAGLQHTDVRRVVLLMTDRRARPPIPLGPKTLRVTKDGPLGWLAFVFARHVFFTQPCFLRDFPGRAVSVNVWHGMPIKRVGLLLDGESGFRSTYAVATSPFWADIVERSLAPREGALVTGLPRNDRLFGDPRPVRAALGLGDDVEHLLLWLPTYRRSVRGHLTVDGLPTGSPFEFDVDPEDLAAHLAARGAALIVKQHWMAAFAGEQRWGDLRVVDDAWLRERSVSLYQVLGAAGALISDVSSVTIDFLLLDRPIIHAAADLEAYGNSRGFSVDDVQELLVGPVATTYPELLEQIDAVLAGEDPEAGRRRRVRALSHTDTDAGATRRLLDAVGLPVR